MLAQNVWIHLLMQAI